METPKHRGRPKGSSSFVNVSINDLVQLLPSEKTAVEKKAEELLEKEIEKDLKKRNVRKRAKKTTTD